MSVGFSVAPAVGRAALKSSARMGKTQALRRFPGPWCCSLTPEGAQEKPAGARRARAPDPDPGGEGGEGLVQGGKVAAKRGVGLPGALCLARCLVRASCREHPRMRTTAPRPPPPPPVEAQAQKYTHGPACGAGAPPPEFPCPCVWVYLASSCFLAAACTARRPPLTFTNTCYTPPHMGNMVRAATTTP
jgi:hypothetical protein